jgi:hypothetical protein
MRSFDEEAETSRTTIFMVAGLPHAVERERLPPGRSAVPVGNRLAGRARDP